MLTDNYIHTINSIMQEQTEGLLRAQNQIATAYYVRRSGALISSTADRAALGDLSVSIEYPKYIRFIDRATDRNGKGKPGYEPIYNKYVYGFLYIGIHRRLSGLMTGLVRKTITDKLNMKL